MAENQTLNRPAHLPHGRLILCNIGRLGDTILRNSILDAASRTYATVDYICGRDNAELLRNDPRLNETTIFTNWLSGLARLFKTAVRHRYEGFIELKNHRSATSLFIARLFRSQVKTGWNSNYARPFDRDVRAVYSPDQHQTETMRRIGQLAGLATAEYKPTLALPPDSINWFERNRKGQKPFIFLNVSATGADRMWPVEQWARYVRGCGLAEEDILINGVPKDREMVNQLCGELPGATAFQPRRFMDVAAAVNQARLVLTVDTGVVHVCSALDKPIVAFYCSGLAGKQNEPLSTRRLVIQASSTVWKMEAQEAIAKTLKHGLP